MKIMGATFGVVWGLSFDLPYYMFIALGLSPNGQYFAMTTMNTIITRNYLILVNATSGSFITFHKLTTAYFPQYGGTHDIMNIRGSLRVADSQEIHFFGTAESLRYS
jgi:hypothetical protein